MGIICIYHPNTNEVFEICKYTDEDDKNNKWKMTCNSAKTKHKNCIVYDFSEEDFSCYNWNKDELAKNCAIYSIRTLMQLNNISVEDLKEY